MEGSTPHLADRAPTLQWPEHPHHVTDWTLADCILSPMLGFHPEPLLADKVISLPRQDNLLKY